jgi:hypothetical protein
VAGEADGNSGTAQRRLRPSPVVTDSGRLPSRTAQPALSKRWRVRSPEGSANVARAATAQREAAVWYVVHEAIVSNVVTGAGQAGNLRPGPAFSYVHRNELDPARRKGTTGPLRIGSSRAAVCRNPVSSTVIFHLGARGGGGRLLRVDAGRVHDRRRHFCASKYRSSHAERQDNGNEDSPADAHGSSTTFCQVSGLVTPGLLACVAHLS